MDKVYNNLDSLREEEDEEEVWEDRGSNMGRLASSLLNEEDDESSQEEGQDETDDEDEDDEDLGEPNKFDNLCDGVINSTAMVNAALRELMDFKDEVLRHALPPSVLVKLALVTSRVFRSVSDSQLPSNELIRLVRVYSAPWEEKSTALKKLHQDYESKQRQLNIAIKRLQLVDAHSKRIAREKRLMNWEKLFSKLTCAKGHGRRWKFMIESIKEKAKLGLEHVHEFARALEESSDEEEIGEEEEEVASRLSGKQGTELCGDDRDTATEALTERNDSDDESKEKGSTIEGSESESGHSVSPHQGQGHTSPQSEGHTSATPQQSKADIEVKGQLEKEGPDITVTMTTESDISSDYSRSGSGKRVRFEESDALPIMEKAPMVDQTTWTDEPKYKRKLHMRVFAPQGLKHQELRCVISLGKQIHRTGVLDPQDDPKDDEEIPEMITEKPETPKSVGKEKLKTETQKTEVEEIEQVSHFEELIFEVPDDIPDGVWVAKGPTSEEFQVAVNSGSLQEMIAMATIKYEDIKSMELATIDLPPPRGDEPKLFVDMKIEDIRKKTEESTDESKPSESLKEPSLFPLFSLQGGKGSCGNLPLVFYWTRTLLPSTFNRQTGTMGVNELVYDMTGIDLDETTKEDLNKDYRDQCTSAMTLTPEPQEETITKEDYDRILEKHQEELASLHEQYESRLQELTENLQNMPTIPPLADSNHGDVTVQRSVSAGSRSHPGRVTVPITPASPPATTEEEAYPLQPRPPSSQKQRKNFRVGRPLPKWGDTVQPDFLSRLEKYETDTVKNRQALSDKVWNDMSKNIEMKLAGQHKLSELTGKMDNLQDVTLPALFMPFKTGNVFNPRAHQYFHPKGSHRVRLTQPPSVFQLPPLSQDKLAVVNLFNLSSNFQNPPSWLMEKYIDQQQPTPQGAPPSTPAFHGAPTSSYVTPFPSMVQEVARSSENNLPVSATSTGADFER